MLNHGVSTGALFLAVGMLYDRRHTHDIKQFGGLATPMPVLMAFFLFIALSSLALPPLNGFIGEFMILIGTYLGHHVWASWAASGAVLSAIYLLWAYQRVAFGEVTVEKNRTLSDASIRERIILVAVSLVIIFMGVASPLFTRRMRASVNNVIERVNLPETASHRATTLAMGVRTHELWFLGGRGFSSDIKLPKTNGALAPGAPRSSMELDSGATATAAVRGSVMLAMPAGRGDQ
jgi:NADH:ubiquinone oxidoreductase subunit 4 (subunit M)